MAGADKRGRSKDEVMSWWDKRQEAQKRKAAHKVTSEELQRRMADRRRQKKEDESPSKLPTMIRTGLAVALLVGTAGVSASVVASNKAFDEAHDANQAQIVSLQADMKRLEPATEKADQRPDLDQQLDEARDKAKRIGKLQDGFGELMYKASKEKLPSNGVPGDAFVASVQHRKELEPYFSRDTFLVKDKVAYSPGSADDFDMDGIDPRFPWFVRYEPGTGQRKVSKPDTYGWELISVVPAGEVSPDEADATWVARDAKTDDLLTWATSSYSFDTNEFGRLRVGTTTVGDRFSIDKTKEAK